jgi:hypothetical protein
MKSVVVLVVSVATLIASPGIQAQSNAPSFDLLRAAHASDSLRRVNVRLQSEVARLTKANAAKSDSIARQRRALDAIRAPRAALGAALPMLANGHPPASIEIDAEPQAPQPVDVANATPTPVVQQATAVPMIAAPAVAVMKPEPVPALAAEPAKAKTAPAPLPAAVTLNGMFQFWMSAGDAGYRNSYRLRRAELKASGAASPKVSWVVMLDFGKTLSASSTMSNGAVQTTVGQSGRALQDATILYQVSPDLRIDAGQQKVPFGLEGSQSSGTLEMVERALFMSDKARGGSFGDVRDAGVALRGKWRTSLDYQVGVFNGSGENQNDTDANLAKALIARVVVRPWPAVQVGASGVYAGNSAGDAPRRDRDAVELRVRTSRVLIQAEAAAGHDATIRRRGAYVHAGFRLRPALDLHLRADGWDPDVDREADAASATERSLLGGATWALASAGLKLQADVARRTYTAGLVPSRWQLMLNLQTNW